MEQKRLVIWIAFSAAILIAWSFLFPHPKTENPQNKADQVQQTASQPTETLPGSSLAANPNQQTEEQPAPATNVPVEAFPQRSITIVTPLYEIKFESRGAVPSSWIIKKNKDTERPINGFGKGPLELISAEGLKKNQAPLRLLTGDQNIDAALSNQTYRVSLDGNEGGSGDLRVEVPPGQNKRLEFYLKDNATDFEVTKSFTFNADDYTPDLAIKATRNGAALSQVKIAIGPSIGDQTVPHYTFYSVAPEAVYNVNDKAERSHGSAIEENKESKNLLAFNGKVDWAGVGDTYFVMVAVPPTPSTQLQYSSYKYEHENNGTKESRYLVTGYLPVPANGETTRLYAGPKDHFLLTKASSKMSEALRRQVDLEGTIDYGWFSYISRPLAVPILMAIKYLRDVTGSYGVAIILFTIVIYSLFFPLKWRSSKAMKKAQKLAPRMKELQEKIKGMKQNDPRLKELQMEQLRLMKEGNPLGGCLPLLIQMPFLFALFRAITISVDFRQAPFLWLPDLSAADTTHVLPILMGASMLVLQLVTPAPSADPLQRKMMAFMMPAMMLWFMWSAPAGLLVYWLVGNIVGFSQQFLINYLTKSGDDAQPPPGKKSESNSTKKLREPRVSQA